MSSNLKRRNLLKAIGATGIASATPWFSSHAFAADKLVVGVIYVGPRDDYGYNQAQALAAAAIKKMSGVTVVEQEKVPETVEVQKVMGSMIEQDGATLLFPTSFGYFDPHMIKMAESIRRFASPIAADYGPKASIPKMPVAISVTSTSASFSMASSPVM